MKLCERCRADLDGMLAADLDESLEPPETISEDECEFWIHAVFISLLHGNEAELGGTTYRLVTKEQLTNAVNKIAELEGRLGLFRQAEYVRWRFDNTSDPVTGKADPFKLIRRNESGELIDLSPLRHLEEEEAKRRLEKKRPVEGEPGAD